MEGGCRYGAAAASAILAARRVSGALRAAFRGAFFGAPTAAAATLATFAAFHVGTGGGGGGGANGGGGGGGSPMHAKSCCDSGDPSEMGSLIISPTAHGGNWLSALLMSCGMYLTFDISS